MVARAQTTPAAGVLGDAAPNDPLAAAPLLRVRGLTVRIPAPDTTLAPVTDLSFDLAPGEILGLVGESGSGKSLSSLALTGLGPATARISGSVEFRGRDLLSLPRHELQAVRGSDIGYVFQDPQAALNPLMTCGRQIVEAIRRHRATPKAAAHRRAVELLDAVGIRQAREVAGKYPHELSGGMRQRVMIAIALSCDPSVIVADEPTTALDVIVEAQVVGLLQRLREQTGAAILFISHDLDLVAGLADRILVMYGGRAMEAAPGRDLVRAPRHPYTQGLIGSVPDLFGPRLERFGGIDGVPPNPAQLPPGCPFAPRCVHATGECDVMPARDEVTPLHSVACWHHAGLAARPPAPALARGDDDLPAAEPTRSAGADEAVPHLEVSGLEVRFGGGRRLTRRVAGTVAVDGVGFRLARGEVLGVVGESGSGKTSLARAVTGLVSPSAGTIRYDGAQIYPPERGRYRPPRSVQMVFQDPYASLNPRMRVSDLVAESFDIREPGLAAAVRDERVVGLLDRVGIDPRFRDRYPHQFSGGQRQRIAIARALAAQPDLLVCDEAVSSLDVSIRAQVLNVLLAERERTGLSILFIAHDLSVVRHLADTVIVMNQGSIVEAGPADDLIFAPREPYTRDLVAASAHSA
ncbi:dipeptide ABC transporter ATP-binding protein [Jiangella mangrovi]|uniref:Peptide/nickel transport system ATP-binding protein n=1 Tax=Jiangella mangrovi TaxID=1524084 RepID=A0A7W9GRB0_9ACTN|nr:peptide/nickel transport system ATP-binding protein [Jiangella mangrovi]